MTPFFLTHPIRHTVMTAPHCDMFNCDTHCHHYPTRFAVNQWRTAPCSFNKSKKLRMWVRRIYENRIKPVRSTRAAPGEWNKLFP